MMTRIFPVLALIASLFIVPLVSAQNIQEANIDIYRDGTVHVRIIVETEENSAYVTIPLLTPDVTNVVVYDELGEPLNYGVNPSPVNGNATMESIEIYSLGASLVRVEYDTTALTSKISKLWTFAVNVPFEFSLSLPENSTIVYINAPPKSITTEGQRIKLEFYPGYCEVSYEIEAQTQIQPQIQPPVSSGQPLFWYVLGCVLVAVLLIFIFMPLRMRRAKLDSLKDDEKKVIEFIKKNGNRALEAELRETFPDIPRTSMWRLLKRLEKQGIIRIRRVGLQNLIELI